MAANTEKKEAKGTQMKGKLKFEKKPCPWLCDMVPVNVPPPGQAQAVLHPRKDVFVLKVYNIFNFFHIAALFGLPSQY